MPSLQLAHRTQTTRRYSAHQRRSTTFQLGYKTTVSADSYLSVDKLTSVSLLFIHRATPFVIWNAFYSQNLPNTFSSTQSIPPTVFFFGPLSTCHLLFFACRPPVNTRSRCTSLFLAIYIDHVLYCTVVFNRSLLPLDLTAGIFPSAYFPILVIQIPDAWPVCVLSSEKRRNGWPGDELVKRHGLTLLGHLQPEIVHIHLKGLIARGQLVDISLDGSYPRKKGCKAALSAPFR